ncbi:hypothetical protein D3C71_1340030 [compost metagenome]
MGRNKLGIKIKPIRDASTVMCENVPVNKKLNPNKSVGNSDKYRKYLQAMSIEITALTMIR